MVTVADVRNRIKADLRIINTSIYDAQIDDAIRSALRELRQRKFWFLEATHTLTLSVADYIKALPNNYGSMREVSLLTSDGRWKHEGTGFDVISYDLLRKEYWTTFPVPSGEPEACAIFNNNIGLSHRSNAAHFITINYFKKDTALPSASETSVWFDDGYDLVRSKAQYIFKRDSLGVSGTDADLDMVAMHEAVLGRRHEQYRAGML